MGKELYEHAELTCRFTDPCDLCSKAERLWKSRYPHAFPTFKQDTVVSVKGCSFSSSFESLWLILVPLNNLHVSFMEVGGTSPNQFATAGNTAWAAVRSVLHGCLIQIQAPQLKSQMWTALADSEVSR